MTRYGEFHFHARLTKFCTLVVVATFLELKVSYVLWGASSPLYFSFLQYLQNLIFTVNISIYSHNLNTRQTQSWVHRHSYLDRIRRDGVLEK
jgi:hypothetical protein